MISSHAPCLGWYNDDLTDPACDHLEATGRCRFFRMQCDQPDQIRILTETQEGSNDDK